jgi:nitrite reductase (cytochrome c-552)
MGFHAPQEVARILGESIDYSRQGQLAAQALVLKSGPATRPANSVSQVFRSVGPQ